MTIQELLYKHFIENDPEYYNFWLDYYTNYELYQKKLDISSIVRCDSDPKFICNLEVRKYDY